MMVGDSFMKSTSYVLKSSAMRRADKMAIEECKIPGILLMESAGRAVAQKACEQLDTGDRVLILTGPGNNGGDGFVAARFLHFQGFDITVAAVQRVDEYSADAAVNAKICESLNINIECICNAVGKIADSQLRNLMEQSNLIIDALLGTGVQGTLRKPYPELVSLINEDCAPTISVDIPTGVSADTGLVKDVAVDAQQTVTFAAPKPGLLLEPGCKWAGRVTVADIGIPDYVIHKAATTQNSNCSDKFGPLIWIQKDWIKQRLPSRPKTGHKGTFGHVLVIAGSPGLSGAAVLAAKGAQRAGAGMVTCASPSSLHQVLQTKLTSAMTAGFPLQDVKDVCAAADQLKPRIQRADAVALGPGLGRSGAAQQLIERLLSMWDKYDFPPLVVDADGLNAVAQNLDMVKQVGGRGILTPHPGEMARLLSCSVSDVISDRKGAALRAARDSGCVVVLKGAPSITASPCGCLAINSSGNVGLAAGGSGDVLTGIISTLLAQRVSPQTAAPAGCYLHGLAADMAREDISVRSLIPEDILPAISDAYRNIVD